MTKTTISAMCFAFFAAWLHATTLKLAPFYTDNMVLQRDKPIVFLGIAAPNSTVGGTFMGKSADVQSDAGGKFKLILPAQTFSTLGTTATFTCGAETLSITNVVVGDVWLCSGQSNMEWNMGGSSIVSSNDIRAAYYPLIRRIKFAHVTAVDPIPFDQMKAEAWQPATPECVVRWTAVGFYFTRALFFETKIPMGIIDCNWGGTRIEPWTPAEAFNAAPVYSNDCATIAKRYDLFKQNGAAEQKWLEKFKAMSADERKKVRKPTLPWDRQSPTALYNAMVDGMTPMPIKGAIWYQGESNSGDPIYDKHMEAMVAGWRKKWGYTFPFYFVQLANFQDASDDPNNTGWGRVRQLQLNALYTIPKAGMAVTIDIGEAKDIHPKNKIDVGDRLARWALRDIYGQHDLIVSGPLFKSMKTENNTAVISFQKGPRSGLTFQSLFSARNRGYDLMVGKKEGTNRVEEVLTQQVSGFAVQDTEGKWTWANAVISGDKVLVSHPEGKYPVAVRYGYQSNPKVNLYNKAGLPASPFTTEDTPQR